MTEDRTKFSYRRCQFQNLEVFQVYIIIIIIIILLV